MSLNASLPGVRQAATEGGSAPLSRPYYLFLQSLATSIDSLSVASEGDVTVPETTINDNANVVGAYSIYTQGTLQTGIVKVLLLGDVQTPGKTQYYGSDATGERGWWDVSDTLAASSNVTITTGANGVSTFDLSDSGVTAGSYGSASSIPVITIDAKGRATSASTVAVQPQVFNRIDAAGDIRKAADGSLRITY